MSKIISQTFPGTDTIPLSGGRLNIYSESIKTDLNDNFIGGYSSELWESSDQFNNVEQVFSPSYHVKVTGNSSSETGSFFISSYPYEMPSLTNLNIKVRVNPFVSPYNGLAGIALVVADQASQELTFEALYISQSNRIYGSISVLAQAGGQPVVGTEFRFIDDQLDPKNLDLNIIFERTPSLLTATLYVGNILIGSKSFSPVSSIFTNTLLLGGTEGVEVYPLAYNFNPVFKGIPNVSGSDISIPDSVRDGFASFSVLPAYPGSFEVYTAGSGSGALEPFTVGDINVVDSSIVEDSMKFLISPVEKFYTDADPFLSCRRFGIPDQDNSGSAVVNLRCVCDGSEEDGTPVYIDFAKSGDLNAKDIANAPAYKFTDEEGKEYGCNYELQRIHYRDKENPAPDEIKIIQDYFSQNPNGESISDLRCLPLNNGDRIYYGLRSVRDQNIFRLRINLTSPIDGKFDTDLTEWKLFKLNENSRNQVASGTTLGDFVYNILKPEDNVSGGVVEGFYCLSFVNALARVMFRYGSDPNYKTLYELSNSEEYFNSFEPSFNQKSSNIYFEIKPYFAKPVIYYFDRCESTLRKFELNNEVLTEPNSFSAVELESKKVIFLFSGKEISDSGSAYLQNLKTYLNYISFNLESKTFGSVSRLHFPRALFETNDLRTGNKKIFAFDAVKTPDGLINIVFSTVSDARFFYLRKNTKNDTTEGKIGSKGQNEPGVGDFPSYESVENTSFFERVIEDVRYRPFLDSGFNSLTFSENDYTFFGDLQIYSYFYSSLPATSIERAMLLYNPIRFSEVLPGGRNRDQRFARSGAAFIRANYDSASGLTIVSTLDTQRRMPFIYAGNRDQWRDVCVPAHFNTYSAFTDFNPSDSFTVIFTCIKTIDACLGYDGNVYSLAVKGSSLPLTGSVPAKNDRTTELGIIDPSILSSSRNYFIEYGYTRQGSRYVNGGRDFQRINFYTGKYRQQIIPILTNYRSASKDFTYSFGSGSICFDKNYLICCFGHYKSVSPIIYQAFNQDEIPFYTQSNEVLLPEFANFTSWTYDGDISATPQYFNFETGESSLYRAITASSLPNSVVNNRLGGMKFHVRAMVYPEISSSVNIFNMELGVLVNPSFSGPNPNMSNRVIACKMSRSAGKVQCWRSLGGDTSALAYALVHEFEVLPSEAETLDYYIFIQPHQENRYRISYVIKRNENLSYDPDSYNFKNNCEIFTIDFNVYNSFGSNANFNSSFAKISRGPDAQAGVGSEVRVYQADISLINEMPHVGFPGNNPNPSGTSRNDRKVFDIYNGDLKDPIHLYRTRHPFLKSVNGYAHWPNGFEFCLSDYSVSSGDRYTLQRESIFNLDSIASNRIHGTWRSLKDDSSIKIYADAFDSGYQTFMFDSLVLEGANFPRFKIIATNDLSDPWQELAEVSLVKFSFNNLQYESGSDYIILEGDFDFNKGKFEWRDSYFNSEDVEIIGFQQTEMGPIAITEPIKASKVIKCEYDRIWITKGAPRNSPNGYIFSNKVSKIFESFHSYRYVGIEILPYRTKEGYFTIQSLDFGKIRDIPLKYNHDVSSGASLESSSKVYFVEDEQAFSALEKKASKIYDLQYSIVDGGLFMKIISAMEAITLKRKPIWIIDNYLSDKEEFTLCLSQNDVNSEVLVDEDGEKFYKINIGFKSVKGE
jgi:hypothetical protein